MRADQEAVIDLENENTKLKAANEALVKALEQAANCIEDLGRGEGGWAWEELVQEIDAVIERTK